MNFYERYCGDYGRDTGDLSLAQHGAYTLMLDHYYATEKPLPADQASLNRICRAMNKAEQDAVRVVADRFFPVGEDGLRHNRRADEEIADAQPRIAAARANGRNGGRPRKTQQKPSGFQDKNPPGNPAETHAGDHHAPRPSESNTPPAPAGGAPDGAIPDCPHERLIAMYHEILPECPRVEEWNDERRGIMRARWREKAKPNGKTQGYSTVEAGLAWWRTYFAWCAQSQFLTGKKDGKPGRPPFIANLEWLVRPSNFAKVVEGNYHR